MAPRFGPLIRVVLPILLLAFAPTSARAADRDFSKVEITTTDLGSGLAMLQGAGGNMGLSTGPDGAILIDDQFAPLSKKIRAAVSTLSETPIRYVLNTHWHGDHTGGNEPLGTMGALIMAHDAVRTRLSTPQPRRDGNILPAQPPAAWPVITWEDGITLHLNGQTVEVRHVAPAHTDGDSVVRFVQADVIHTGDTFFSGRYPFLDVPSGGRIGGMVAAADFVLSLCGPETRIIPGHGPLSRPADLRAYRDMLASVRDRVKNMVSRGLDRKAVIRAKPTQTFDAEFSGGVVSPTRFVGFVYDSLVAEPWGSPPGLGRPRTSSKTRKQAIDAKQ